MLRTSFGLVSGVVAVLTAAPVAAQVAVDSYVCYGVRLASRATPFVPVQKSLLDAFPPTRTYWLKKVTTLCNPASVNFGPRQHPTEHEVGYRLRAVAGSPRFARRTLTAIDQFGTHTMQVRRPESLLVPSSKLLGTSGAPPLGTPNIRHYECYRVRAESVEPPAGAYVADQFRDDVYESRKVTKLCTPVDKNGEDPQAPNDPTHLVCYQVRAPGVGPTASTNNQIRPETLVVQRPRELCVPALVVAPGPTTTSSTSTSFVISTSTTGPTTTSTSTLPPPCGDPTAPPAPLCWGECPASTPLCAATVNGCECVAGSTPCGSATFPQCDGACGAGEACVVSPTLGCTCQFQGIPCAAAYALTGTCGGVCPQDYTCAGPFFTPDGDGCACVPNGSTCHLTCGNDPGAGNCPPGQSCGQPFPGACFCQ